MTGQPSIHDLFAQVREHPDFAGGTIFTREDVAYALFAGEDDDVEDVTPEMLAKVTDDHLRQSQNVMSNYIFEGSYSWSEAMRDCIEVSA